MLYNTSQDRAEYCSGGQGSAYLWLGANDKDIEGQWVYTSNSQPLNWEGPWRGLGPNGGSVENCLVLLTGNFPAAWSDIACLETYSFCVPCEFEKLSMLHLKGPSLCDNSPFNRQYFFGGEKNGRPFLAGLFHSDIYWDPLRESWMLQSLKEPKALASWKPKQIGLYPFGTNHWTMMGEECGILSNEVIPLTISACEIGQFTCNDGTCINLMKRCDLRFDCPDKSDENDCSLLDIPLGYSKAIVPPPLTEGDQLLVFFSLSLISFPSIITQDLTFTTNFKLFLTWQDLRLNFLNLKEDLTLNLLSSEEVRSIWSPLVFFSNAQNNIFTNLDQGSRIECVQQGALELGPHTLAKEGERKTSEAIKMLSCGNFCSLRLGHKCVLKA
ncbi:hypothetical protein SK128_019624 [Halocaridina rubra]|uniref:C-type lectin domain-containing protein n=1 Tax=Halocaridina rubra TaxID=373956 RepID=A0AAN8WZ23_HALRR